MSWFRSLKENWLQPFFFFGNNPITLIGSGLTTASAITLVAYWLAETVGRHFVNPYLGIIFFLILPALFVAGLALVPVGMVLRRNALQKTASLPATYPEIHLSDPLFRHGVLVVVGATLANLIIVGTASYHAVTYMDSPHFCGQSCHVMAPQWTAYQESPHSHVDCVECHVGSGMKSYVQAKVNGTKQLIEVTFHRWPTPIRATLNGLRPARETCEECHTPAKFIGEKLLVKTTFGDDEKNAMTRTVLVLHLGGLDSVSHLTGIHGHHLDNFEYVASDADAQTILAVSKPNPDGTTTDYMSSDAKGPFSQLKGVRRTMDCMDCHNQATHVFQTAQQAIDEAMVDGTPSPDLPFVHKQGLALIQATYSSQAEAGQKIVAGLDDFYRIQYPEVWRNQRPLVDAAAQRLVAIYDRNVFPEMKVTWGTYPNNIGHMDYPGCFRCHDGSHTTKNGKTLSNDCSLCHNILATDETNPSVLNDLQLQNEIRLQ
jgi:nitrate/TMAO reductase-like tetraheme cytochrome c subunit